MCLKRGVAGKGGGRFDGKGPDTKKSSKDCGFWLSFGSPLPSNPDVCVFGKLLKISQMSMYK